MTSPSSLFCSQLSNLCDELSDMYPNDLDIKTGKRAVDTLKSVNPKLLVKSFKDHVMPYKQHILDRNDSFFLHDLDYSKLAGDDKNLVTAMNLKKYWGGMSENTKDCMWQYFGVLVKLAEKC
jgi:hypothetical protein